MIYEGAITQWRNKVQWQYDTQVEQDLLLSGLICDIYSHPLLKEQLAFRGGICPFIAFPLFDMIQPLHGENYL